VEVTSAKRYRVALLKLSSAGEIVAAKAGFSENWVIDDSQAAKFGL